MLLVNYPEKINIEYNDLTAIDYLILSNDELIKSLLNCCNGTLLDAIKIYRENPIVTEYLVNLYPFFANNFDDVEQILVQYHSPEDRHKLNLVCSLINEYRLSLTNYHNEQMSEGNCNYMLPLRQLMNLSENDIVNLRKINVELWQNKVFMSNLHLNKNDTRDQINLIADALLDNGQFRLERTLIVDQLTSLIEVNYKKFNWLFMYYSEQKEVCIDRLIDEYLLSPNDGIVQIDNSSLYILNSLYEVTNLDQQIP